MPPVEAAYVVGMLHEAGLASSSGMGPSSLSWQEIEAWLRVTESNPSLWDRLMVKELSEAYVSELSAATDLNRPDPYVPVEEFEVDRDAVASKLKGFLRGFKKPKPQRKSPQKPAPK